MHDMFPKCREFLCKNCFLNAASPYAGVVYVDVANSVCQGALQRALPSQCSFSPSALPSVGAQCILTSAVGPCHLLAAVLRIISSFPPGRTMRCSTCSLVRWRCQGSRWHWCRGLSVRSMVAAYPLRCIICRCSSRQPRCSMPISSLCPVQQSRPTVRLRRVRTPPRRRKRNTRRKASRQKRRKERRRVPRRAVASRPHPAAIQMQPTRVGCIKGGRVWGSKQRTATQRSAGGPL